MNSTWLTVSTPTFSRKAAAQIALAAAIFAASLWDFRLSTLRIFDLAALALLCPFFVLTFDIDRGWVARRRYFLPLVIVVVLYAGLGYLDFHHRSSLAIALLAVIGLQLAGLVEGAWLARMFRWALYLNVSVLLVQFFSFHMFGFLLDPQRLLGSVSRILLWYDREPYLRPAGLFQEPNNWALNAFLMATAALAPKRDRVLALFVAGSMLITESMWAAAAAFVLVSLNEWNSPASFVRKTAVTLSLWTAMFACYNVYVWLTKPTAVSVPPLYARVLHLPMDSSARARYGTLLGETPSFGCLNCPSKPASVKLPKALGRGLSTSVFFTTVPDNGFSFFWYCMGPVGLPLLIVALLWSVYGTTLQDTLYVVASVVFAFTTYPIITYAVLWLWLVALIAMVRQRPEPVAARDSPFAARLQFGAMRPSPAVAGQAEPQP